MVGLAQYSLGPKHIQGAGILQQFANGPDARLASLARISLTRVSAHTQEVNAAKEGDEWLMQNLFDDKERALLEKKS